MTQTRWGPHAPVQHVTTLPDGLHSRLPDGEFLARAYRMCLGREADAAGFVEGLHRLRRGIDRAAVLADLLDSPEAHVHLGDAQRQLAQGVHRPLHQRLWSRLRRQLRGPRRHPPDAVPAVLRPPDNTWALTPGPCRQRTAGPAASPSVAWPAVRRQALFTIATHSYLPQVRVLLASLGKHHPDQARVLVLIDSPRAHLTATELGLGADTLVVPAAALDMPSFDDMSVRYDTLELSTAVKPWAMMHLLSKAGFEQVVYLDPDIELHAPMTDALRRLDTGASMVVTPHLLRPLPAPGTPDDHAILKSGVFNLGFLAVRRCEESLAFIRWWAEQLQTRCIVSFEQNLFTDQRWCDLLPCFVEHLHVLRHPGYNVAYWNLEQRPLTQDAQGRWRTHEHPLVFFHFSGFDPREPGRCSRHQTRLSPTAVAPVLALLQDYAATLVQAGWPGNEPSPPQDPAAGRLPAVLRQFYRHQHPTPVAQDRTLILARLLRDALTPDGQGLPPVLRFLHQNSSELQAVFDLRKPGSAADFARWVRCCALDKLGLQGLAAGPHSTPTLTQAR